MCFLPSKKNEGVERVGVSLRIHEEKEVRKRDRLTGQECLFRNAEDADWRLKGRFEE